MTSLCITSSTHGGAAKKFTSWSLEKYDGYKLVAKRGGYIDNETGAFSTEPGKKHNQSIQVAVDL